MTDMDLFGSLAKLDIPPDWCILHRALSWLEEMPLITADAVQRHAAALLVEGNTDSEILELAILREDQLEETREVTGRLSSGSECSIERAEDVLFLVIVNKSVAEAATDDPVSGISELASLFSDPSRPAHQPPSIVGWRSGRGDPAAFWSDKGFRTLHTEIMQWVELERRRLLDRRA